jgi:hypothetical protein
MRIFFAILLFLYAEQIKTEHLAEAIQYKRLDKQWF